MTHATRRYEPARSNSREALPRALVGRRPSTHEPVPTSAAHDPSFIERMTRLFTELNSIGERVGEMPDDAMDHITEAASIVCNAIIGAPVHTEADIAGKLRFAAALVEMKDGVYLAEKPAACGAVADLLKFRTEEFEREWAEVAKDFPTIANA